MLQLSTTFSEVLADAFISIISTVVAIAWKLTIDLVPSLLDMSPFENNCNSALQIINMFFKKEICYKINCEFDKLMSVNSERC